MKRTNVITVKGSDNLFHIPKSFNSDDSYCGARLPSVGDNRRLRKLDNAIDTGDACGTCVRKFVASKKDVWRTELSENAAAKVSYIGTLMKVEKLYSIGYELAKYRATFLVAGAIRIEAEFLEEIFPNEDVIEYSDAMRGTEWYVDETTADIFRIVRRRDK